MSVAVFYLLNLLFCFINARPNILVLFADDLGSGDLAVYGHPTTSTPNLDALAASGIRFTQWYSGFHVCSPSRGSMMTGRLPVRIGLAGASWTGGVFDADSVGGLPHNETTVAEALSALGYATKAIGKWHCGQQPQYLPTAHGFDSYYGIPYSDDMGPSAWDVYHNKDRPPLPLISSTSMSPERIHIIEQPTNLNLLSPRYVNESIAFITSKSALNISWFLYMAFNHVHVPDFASPTFCNTTKRGLFGDALAELDAAVGDIVQSVVDAGVDNNTLIVFTSDNGPWLIKGAAGGSAGLLKDGKETTWEGGIREPGIIRWTGKIEGGRISRQVVATYDIFTTSIVVAGGQIPTDRIIDGVDLSPLLFDTEWEEKQQQQQQQQQQQHQHQHQHQVEDQSSSTLHPCLYHYKGTPYLNCPAEHPNCPGLWAVRCGNYKLHYVTSTYLQPNNGTFENPPLIFHIEHDPSEKYPLLTSSDNYKTARAWIEKNVVEHQKKLKWVPPQMARGKDPSLAICCTNTSVMVAAAAVNVNGNMKNQSCVCNPENWNVFVCQRPPVPR